jgi:hypothetical protein
MELNSEKLIENLAFAIAEDVSQYISENIKFKRNDFNFITFEFYDESRNNLVSLSVHDNFIKLSFGYNEDTIEIDWVPNHSVHFKLFKFCDYDPEIIASYINGFFSETNKQRCQ